MPIWMFWNILWILSTSSSGSIYAQVSDVRQKNLIDLHPQGFYY